MHDRSRLARLVVLIACCALAVTALSRVAGAAVSDPAATSVPPVGVREISVVPRSVDPELVFWTGERVLLFGDSRSGARDAGATFDPAADRWRTIAVPPFDPPLAQPNAVWTGEELVVIGVSCAPGNETAKGARRCVPGTLQAGSYDPAEDSWRRLRLPTLLKSDYRRGNDGSAGAPLGMVDGVAVFQMGRLWSFDPSSDRWRELPRAYGLSCATDDAVVGLLANTIATLDIETATWTQADPAPSPDSGGTLTPVCSQGGVYAFPRTLSNAFRFDVASRAWSTLPAPPQPPASVGGAFWTGTELVIGTLSNVGSGGRYPDGRGLALALGASEWRDVQVPVNADPRRHGEAWVDGYAYVLGRNDAGRATLSTYRPG